MTAMRKAKRDEIARSAAVQGRLIDVEEAVSTLCDAIEQVATDLGKKIDAVQPAQVDLTQEMADDIVRKIHGPLTISKEFSQFVAEQGKFHDFYYVFPVGYGSDSGRGEIRLQGTGAMYLQFRDHNGADLWRGTFVPADFGKS